MALWHTKAISPSVWPTGGAGLPSHVYGLCCSKPAAQSEGEGMRVDHPYNFEALGSLSKRLAAAIFSAMPELQGFAGTICAGEQDGLSLKLVVPSPTKEAARLCAVWVDEVATPSIEFGPTHTHESADEDGTAAIADRLGAILGDSLLIVEDVGGPYPEFGSWIDLREPDALVDQLTSRYSSGHVLLKSWSGKVDRDVSVDDLSRDISGSPDRPRRTDEAGYTGGG